MLLQYHIILFTYNTVYSLKIYAASQSCTNNPQKKCGFVILNWAVYFSINKWDAPMLLSDIFVHYSQLKGNKSCSSTGVLKILKDSFTSK